jgi:hypothetical protein
MTIDSFLAHYQGAFIWVAAFFLFLASVRLGALIVQGIRILYRRYTL